MLNETCLNNFHSLLTYISIKLFLVILINIYIWFSNHEKAVLTLEFITTTYSEENVKYTFIAIRWLTAFTKVSLSFFITISSARAIEISKWQPAMREWGFHISLLTAALRIKDYTDIWPPAVIQTKNSSLSYLHENVVWESLGGKWCCRKLWCGFYWYFCKKITFTTDFVDFSLIFYIQNKSRSYKAFELTACKLCHSPRGLSIFSNCAQHHQLHVLPNLREHPVFSALASQITTLVKLEPIKLNSLAGYV